MGKFDFNVSDDFLKALGRLADVDRVAPQMIDEAMPIIEGHVRHEIGAKILDSEYSKGDMLKSVKNTKAKRITSGGYFGVTRPTGKDRKGVRNMEKMAYAEFGTSKQSATPMLTKAIKDSEAAVLSKMQEVFEREVKK